MQVLNIFHVLVAIALIGFVLIQRGQGATAGAAFGSGASGTVFGARGAGNFLSRSTWVLAGLFCAISLTMAVLVSRMMEQTPEQDLGVVAAVEQAAEAVEQPVPITEQSIGAGEAAPIDVPAFEPVADALPAVEESSAVGADDNIGEDLPPVESAEEATQPVTEDN